MNFHLRRYKKHLMMPNLLSHRKKLYYSMEKEMETLTDFLRDDLMQLLFAAKLQMDKRQQQPINCISEALYKTRQLINRYDMQAVDRFGLENALLHLLAKVRTEKALVFTLKTTLDQFSQRVAYRILQEVVGWIEQLMLSQLLVQINSNHSDSIVIEILLRHLDDNSEMGDFFQNKVQESTLPTRVLFDAACVVVNEPDQTRLTFLLQVKDSVQSIC